MSVGLSETRQRQRRAAAPALSAWVSANAGAGKTRVLVERVIRLLLAGAAPDKILCLTFTKAAAAEMAERLFATLGNLALADDAAIAKTLEDLGVEGAPVSDMDAPRRLFARAIETPGGLKIQTIHAFAQSLLRRFPREAGVPPHFAVLDDGEAAMLLRQARDHVFLAARHDPELEAALGHLAIRLNEDGLDALLDQWLTKRRLWRDLVEQAGSQALALGRLRRELGLGVDEDEARLDQELIRGALDLDRMIAALAKGTKSNQDQAAGLAADRAAGRFDLDRYRAIFLTQDFKARDGHWYTKGARQADPAFEPLMVAEQLRLEALEARRRLVQVWAATHALVHVAEAILHDYENAKRSAARLDYDDLIDATLGLLTKSKAAAWVLYKLDGGLDHILVDEAQDTSPSQWAIVQALAEEFFAGEGARASNRTVFAVGDAKQSIYGFQGADPTGFARMGDYFARSAQAAGRTFEAIGLDVSFRSTAEVLNLVDAVFAEAGVLGQGIARLSHLATRTAVPGRVELWPIEEPQAPSEPQAWTAPVDQPAPLAPPARLAQKIAGKIAAWLGPEGEMIPSDRDGDGRLVAPYLRRVRPGDILILVRRRDAFVVEMIRALKQAGIPVAGADRLRLGEQIAVKDLIAAGRACLLPEDDLNLASLLVSPLIGWSDDDLFQLAAHRGMDEKLIAALERATGPREAQALALLAQWRTWSGALTPFDFYTRLLNSGGRRRLLERLGPESGDPIDEFLAQALSFERGANPTLEAFLHRLDTHEVEIKRDLDQGGGQVRVMTVHGAKGLEAEIVFLPDTCTLPGGSKPPRFLTLGPSAPDSQRPSALAYVPNNDLLQGPLANARAGLDLTAGEEHRRLLYVALTRARTWLYIAGYRGSKPVDPGAWHPRLDAALTRLDATTIETADGSVRRLAGTRFVAMGPLTEGSDRAPPIKPDWLDRAAPLEPGPRAPLAPSRLGADDQPPRPPKGADVKARFRRGRLIHRLLQSLPDLPPDRRSKAAQDYLDRHAGDLDQIARDALVAEVMGVIAAEPFAALFAPGGQAEVALAGSLPESAGEVVLSGQIDRLVVTDRQVLIADYKTNRPPPRRIEDVAPAYLRQMAAYRLALQVLYPGKQIRAALVWTDGPLLMELPDALLAAVGRDLFSQDGPPV